MTDKIDTSPEAVERFTSPSGYLVPAHEYDEGFGYWVRHDDYRALSARVAEVTDEWEKETALRVFAEARAEAAEQRVADLEHRNVALGEAVAYAEQRAATLEADLDAMTLDRNFILQSAEKHFKRAATLEAKLAKVTGALAHEVKRSRRHLAGSTLAILAEITETKDNDT